MINRDPRVELLLGAIVQDKILFVEVMSRFSGRLFGRDEYDEMLAKMRTFYEEYRRPPVKSEFKVYCGKVADDWPLEDIFLDTGLIGEVPRKKLYEIYQARETLKMIEDIENKIDGGKLDVRDIFLTMKQVVIKTSEPDRTYTEINRDNIVNEYELAKNYRVENTSALAFKNITRLSQGGIASRELLIFVAPPNRGKTTYLINEAYQGLLQGEKVLILSMENEKESIDGRLADRILLMPRHEQRVKEPFCKDWVRKFFCMVKPLDVMYKPAGTFTVQDLDLWLEEYEIKHGEKFDRVIVDYMDKMKKLKAFKNSDDWEDIRRIADDLRAVAIARNLKIITAAQTNRSGIVSKEGSATETVHEGMISGAFGKFETADIVLAYSETLAEKKRGTGRVGVLKVRETGGRGREVVVNMAPWIGLITDCAEEILPPDRRFLLENPDMKYGDLKGIEVKPPRMKRSGAPRVADMGGKADGPVKSDGVNI